MGCRPPIWWLKHRSADYFPAKTRWQHRPALKTPSRAISAHFAHSRRPSWRFCSSTSVRIKPATLPWIWCRIPTNLRALYRWRRNLPTRNSQRRVYHRHHRHRHQRQFHRTLKSQTAARQRSTASSTRCRTWIRDLQLDCRKKLVRWWCSRFCSRSPCCRSRSWMEKQVTMTITNSFHRWWFCRCVSASRRQSPSRLRSRPLKHVARDDNQNAADWKSWQILLFTMMIMKNWKSCCNLHILVDLHNRVMNHEKEDYSWWCSNKVPIFYN